ncbi:class I SAM-dependent methyltransferase [Paractinoplanes globisporus]|uniref:S-adenosyl-L-methionine-dependent methyltransferase n=1 Tax=Paractinoplanes globisporus TaxID=113565 RepID=A0ABW6WPT0_9ACTN|nr:SAM-dependent methyltransferase [Actinoplanes globisporus]
MASERVEGTAFGVGLLRAIEGRVDPGRRLFEDPVAERLLTGWPAWVVRHRTARRAFMPLMELAAPGFFGGVVCRTRVIDDACRETLVAGVRQVVILGAGMDTRPYRMAAMRTARVWELDLPRVQAAKRARLGDPPGQVRYVPIDLAEGSLRETLAASGHDADLPTLVLCEGVTQYLPRTVVDSIFAYAGSLPTGSRLVFTYLPKTVLDDPEQARRVRRFHWQTGFDPADVPRHLADRGLTLTRDWDADQYRELLLRPLHRDLKVFEIERLAIAGTP